MDRLRQVDDVGRIEDVRMVVAENTVVVLEIELIYDRSGRRSVAAVSVADAQELAERVVYEQQRRPGGLLPIRLKRVVPGIAAMSFENNVLVVDEWEIVVCQTPLAADSQNAIGLPVLRIGFEERTWGNRILVEQRVAGASQQQHVIAVVADVRCLEERMPGRRLRDGEVPVGGRGNLVVPHLHKRNLSAVHRPRTCWNAGERVQVVIQERPGTITERPRAGVRFSRSVNARLVFEDREPSAQYGLAIAEDVKRGTHPGKRICPRRNVPGSGNRRVCRMVLNARVRWAIRSVYISRGIPDPESRAVRVVILAHMVESQTKIDGQPFRYLPGILRVAGNLMVLNRSEGIRVVLVIGLNAARQLVGDDVIGGVAAPLLKFISAVSADIEPGLEVLILVPVESELHRVVAPHFAQVVVDSRVRFRRAKHVCA